MTRYIRLGYLVPRLVLLVVLVCAAEFGSGWALRYALVSSGEQALGARVEIGKTDVSLLSTRATLADLRVANPKEPMSNLLEADRVDLDFDADSLLRRQAVVDKGVVRGLRFATQRETSGALDPDSEDSTIAPSWLGDSAKQAITESADKWIEGIEAKLTGQADDLESVRLAEELSEQWPNRFDEMTARARELQAEVEALKSFVSEARTNPLRHAEFLAKAPQKAEQLRERLAGLQADLRSLPEEVRADRERITAARQHDEALLRQRLQVDQLDPDSLTSALLGDRVTSSVQELVSWVRWTREMMPTGHPKAKTTPRARGVDVHFAGVQRRPDILVRLLEVNGSARLAGRPVELTGTVSDFTTSPALHGEPMVVALTTSGGLPLTIRATIDRSQQVPVDDLLVDCPTLDLPKAELGANSGFGLTMAPSTASLSVSLHLVGETISGEMQLVQDRVSLTPNPAPDSGQLARRLGEVVGAQLSSVSQPATRVTLSGDLNNPRVKLWSTLGPAVAESLRNGASQLVQRQAEEQLEKGRARVDAELAQLDSLLHDAMTDLTAQVEAPRQEIERLATNLIGGGQFSLEQLGNRLSGGSLFK